MDKKHNGLNNILQDGKDNIISRGESLGTISLDPDILYKANIGLWAFELDEGKAPRMYVDDAMLNLIGLDHQISPEETYHAWYDHIDKDSYGLVAASVEKMTAGERAEVQYPWHHPDGRTMIVRCGGVRNYQYKRGVRIEGTHQDVTRMIHFDEEEHQKSMMLQAELVKSKFRADSLAYIADNDVTLDEAIDHFGQRILEVSGCDQVIFRETNGSRRVINAKGISDISQHICAECPFAQFTGDVYEEEGAVLMNDCAKGYKGVMAHPNCPAKSSFMQRVYLSGQLVGLLTVHYLNDYHTFSENGIDIMKTVAVYLGLLIGRVNEKNAERARIEAESANKAKTDFLFNMSHDIRTPMNAIIGFNNMAIRNIDDKEKVIDCLEKSGKASGLLLSLINSILDMSRIESGKAVVEEQDADICEIFGDVDATMQELAKANDIELTFAVGDVADRYVYADCDRMNRIFTNIITNAIKYTPAGGHVKAEVSQIEPYKEQEGCYKYVFSDDGIGMSEQFMDKVFDQFTREEDDVVSSTQGTGLGLSVVKSFVELLQGTIKCESTKGVGTTFTVILPHKIRKDGGKSSGNASRGATDAGHNMLKGKRLLLCEDNELNREICVDVLSEQEAYVEEAVNGQVAVDMLRQKGPSYYDCILMDIQMPVMGGYAATKAIRAMYPNDRLPIIALSANAFAEDRAASKAAGMDAHVAKPINMKELFEVLSEFL